MLNSEISSQLYTFLDNYSSSSKEAVGKAFLSASLEMKSRARNLLINNQYGYKMDSLSKAILVKESSDPDEWRFEALLHSYGPRNKSNAKDDRGHYIDKSFMARWFVGGTKQRFSKVGSKTKYLGSNGHFYNRKANIRSYVGAIKPIDAISQALSRAILMNKLQDAVKSKE